MLYNVKANVCSKQMGVFCAWNLSSLVDGERGGESLVPTRVLAEHRFDVDPW